MGAVEYGAKAFAPTNPDIELADNGAASGEPLRDPLGLVHLRALARRAFATQLP